MSRPDWETFEARCQKPDHRRVGHWFARRVSRPMALRVTWLILPMGISAHAMTLCAWICATAAALSFATGIAHGWLLGAVLLHAWYLLDHVDGQLARWNGTASLAGVQLDYLMHHTVNVMVPFGAGYGVAATTNNSLFALAGAIWGIATLAIGLIHDTRQKAFEQRLKRIHGNLQVVGGGGGRPQPPQAPPRRVTSFVAWLALKACEPQAVLLALPLVTVAMLVGIPLDRVYVACMAVVSLAVAIIRVTREVQCERAETAFAAWFQPADGHDLTFENGWWHVRLNEMGFEPAPSPLAASDRLDRDAA